MQRLMQNSRQIIMPNKNMKRIEETITRVQKMEQYFDEIAEVVRLNPKLLQSDASIREKLEELIVYYEGGLWMQDYECDERGELPKDLKKGVLSEDGVYNLLTEVNENCYGSIEDENFHTESYCEK